MRCRRRGQGCYCPIRSIPKLQIKELNVWGNNSLALVGDSAPTKAPDRAGQFYIDKTARALYFSTGNAAVSDWKIQ